jgi:hypothetical protein
MKPNATGRSCESLMMIFMKQLNFYFKTNKKWTRLTRRRKSQTDLKKEN